MTIVVDTSAIFALLKADDANSETARRLWLGSRSLRLVTHSYVVSEALSLLRARIGWSAIDDLVDGLLPLIRVEMVDRALHDTALATYRTRHGGTSFVDHVTMAFARREGITEAFAFDRDLVAAGLRFPKAVEEASE